MFIYKIQENDSIKIWRNFGCQCTKYKISYRDCCEKAQNDRLAVVVSAFSGVTDLLLKTSNEAALKNESYLTTLEEIKQKHFETITNLVAKKIKMIY